MLRSLLTIVGSLVGTGLMILFYVYSSHGAFERMNDEIDLKWQKLEAAYQQRLMLVPTFVKSTVRGLEDEALLEELRLARETFDQAKDVDAKAVAATELESVMERLFHAIEASPKLSVNQLVIARRLELDKISEQLKVDRKRFNAAVQHYNDMITEMPGRYIADRYDFSERHPFEMPGDDEEEDSSH